MKISWMFSSYGGYEITIVEIQRGIIPKMCSQELLFLCFTHYLMLLYISMKFHENILNAFLSYRVDTKLQLSNFKGRITQKMYRQELRFLCSAPCLMMLYISLKFHENILISFQVIELTQNYVC